MPNRETVRHTVGEYVAGQAYVSRDLNAMSDNRQPPQGPDAHKS